MKSSTGVNIPPRVSSKAARVHRLEEVDREIENSRKRVSRHSSFDYDFYSKREEFHKLQVKRSRIFHASSMEEFKENTGLGEAEWINTSQASAIIEDVRSKELELRLVQKQKDRMNTEDPSNEKRAIRDMLIRLFTTSKIGLDIKTTNIKRPRDRQKDFAHSLCQVSKCNHPSPALNEKSRWCPITGLWFPSAAMKAVHIYPWASGEAQMQYLFQTDESEMFSPLNGIYMSADAEGHLDNGHYILVPDVKDQTDLTQMTAWYNSNPRNYKIRILEHKAMTGQILEGKDRLWSDLEGKRVEFLSDHRPRARCLNYIYLRTMLRRSWNPKLDPVDVLKDELGKPWWGTRTKRMATSQLVQAIIEEGGQDYYGLGPIPGDEGEEDLSGDMGKGKGKAVECVGGHAKGPAPSNGKRSHWQLVGAWTRRGGG